MGSGSSACEDRDRKAVLVFWWRTRAVHVYMDCPSFLIDWQARRVKLGYLSYENVLVI